MRAMPPAIRPLNGSRNTTRETRAVSATPTAAHTPYAIPSGIPARSVRLRQVKATA